MFAIRGTRTARIKTYQHHERQCENCKDFNLTIGVFHDYYHFWFIPIVASGIKSSVIFCNSCGDRIRSNSLSKEYESKTKVPFYLYSGAIVVGLVLFYALAINLWKILGSNAG